MLFLPGQNRSQQFLLQSPNHGIYSDSQQLSLVTEGKNTKSFYHTTFKYSTPIKESSVLNLMSLVYSVAWRRLDNFGAITH